MERLAIFNLFVLIIGIQATSYFNLMDKFKIDATSSNLPTDVTSIPGPNGKGKALQYGPGASPVYEGGSTPAYTIYALTHSSDFTYYTWVRIPRKLEKNEKWILFALQQKKAQHITPVLFSVGLTSKSQSGTSVEGDESPTSDFKQILFVQQYTNYDRLSKATDFHLKTPLVAGQWYQLMLRIKTERPAVSRRKRRALGKATVQVRIDCKDMGSFDLQEGPFEKYPTSGFMSFGCELEETSKDVYQAINRFPGALAKSQLMTNTDAFDWYSPCDADFSTQNIPSEPLQSEYSDKKRQAYLRMTKDAKAITLTCPDAPGSQIRYNGETWDDGNCLQYTCLNGAVSESWICAKCKDPVTNKEHRKGDSWIDSQDKCTKNTCLLRHVDIQTENLLPCTEPTCSDGFPPIQLPNECCKKCASDTCDEGFTYRDGCKVTCEDGPNYVCTKKEKGCWCPPGKVEDAEGNCVSLSKCPCKSGKVVYKPGQTAIRSACSTCVCLNSVMECFERC